MSDLLQKLKELQNSVTETSTDEEVEGAIDKIVDAILNSTLEPEDKVLLIIDFISSFMEL